MLKLKTGEHFHDTTSTVCPKNLCPVYVATVEELYIQLSRFLCSCIDSAPT